MNNLRKKSAISTFGELAKTTSEKDLTLLLAKSDAHYTPEEIEELLETFYPEQTGGSGDNSGGSGDKEPEGGAADTKDHTVDATRYGPQGSPGTSDVDAEVERRVQQRLAEIKEQEELEKKAAEQNKVTPANNRVKLEKFAKFNMRPVKQKMLVDGVKKDVVTGYERTGDALQYTMIEQRHADLLNAHVRQSNTWLFKEGEDGFVSMDTISDLGG